MRAVAHAPRGGPESRVVNPVLEGRAFNSGETITPTRRIANARSVPLHADVDPGLAPDPRPALARRPLARRGRDVLPGMHRLVRRARDPRLPDVGRRRTLAFPGRERHGTGRRRLAGIAPGGVADGSDARVRDTGVARRGVDRAPAGQAHVRRPQPPPGARDPDAGRGVADRCRQRTHAARLRARGTTPRPRAGTDPSVRRQGVRRPPGLGHGHDRPCHRPARLFAAVAPFRTRRPGRCRCQDHARCAAEPERLGPGSARRGRRSPGGNAAAAPRRPPRRRDRQGGAERPVRAGERRGAGQRGRFAAGEDRVARRPRSTRARIGAKIALR